MSEERCWSPTSATSSAPGRAPSVRRCRCCTPTSAAGDHTGILTVQSLSKRSNLAGYRCAFVAGDPAVVAELLAVRKNLGLMMPGPQQHAMQVALDDDAARGGAARPLRAAPRPAACRDRGGGTARRPLRRRAVPVGDPWRALLGHASAGSPSAASSWLRGRSTAPPVPSTCGSRSRRPTSVWRRRSGCSEPSLRSGAAARAAPRDRLTRRGGAANIRTAEMLPMRITACS